MDNGIGENRNRSTKVKIFEMMHLVAEIIWFLAQFLTQLFYGFYSFVFPPEEKNVAGEIVLITGTGHGIGKELARQYGELGAEVVCVDVNPLLNEKTLKELTDAGIRAHAFTCDVRSRESVLQMSKKVLEEVGDVSILVNNAGVMPCKRFLAHSPEEIQRMFDVNVFAHFWMLQAFLPTMIKNNKGHIVGISSIAGLVGSPNVVPYSAAKYAVRGFMEGLREEIRTLSDKHNIHFTTVFPYMTDTGLCQKPRIKFDSFMRMLTPSETAKTIISAQRRNYVEATAPAYLLYTNNLVRMLPSECAKLIIDFLGAALEEVN